MNTVEIRNREAFVNKSLAVLHELFTKDLDGKEWLEYNDWGKLIGFNIEDLTNDLIDKGEVEDGYYPTDEQLKEHMMSWEYWDYIIKEELYPIILNYCFLEENDYRFGGSVVIPIYNIISKKNIEVIE